MTEIAQTRVRYGYRRIHILMQREGWRINHKRLYRLYQQAGLNLRMKRPRRRVSAAHRAARTDPMKVNQVWSMDFVSDALFNGKRFRTLTLLDVFSRECLAIHVDVSIRAERVVEIMRSVTQARGTPERIQLKNPALKVQGFKGRLKVASIFQNEHRVVSVVRISVMLQIRLHHLLCHIPRTPRPISSAPKMPSPIPLLQMRVFLLQPSRCPPFHPLLKVTDRQLRRVLHVHVDVIFAHDATQDTDVLSLADLNQQLSAAWFEFTHQDVISIFGCPHDMHGQSADGMVSCPLPFHFSILASVFQTRFLKDLH